MKDGFIKVGTTSPILFPADVIQNTKQIIKAIKKAEKEKVKVLVFPELAITAYTAADLFLMNDLQDINQSEEGNEAYIAVANILKAHQASLLTDLWADVPYTEALQGESEGNFTPTYSTQQEVYTEEGGVLDLLEKSVATLATTTGVIEGDIMFDGNKVCGFTISDSCWGIIVIPPVNVV